MIVIELQPEPFVNWSLDGTLLSVGDIVLDLEEEQQDSQAIIDICEKDGKLVKGLGDTYVATVVIPPAQYQLVETGIDGEGNPIYENEKLKEIFPQYETAYRRKSSYDAITSGLELFSHMVENGEYCVSTSLQLIKRGEHVRILDNLLRWKERKKAQKSEAELWENTERNMMRTLRRMRSSYRMQAQNR